MIYQTGEDLFFLAQFDNQAFPAGPVTGINGSITWQVYRVVNGVSTALLSSPPAGNGYEIAEGTYGYRLSAALNNVAGAHYLAVATTTNTTVAQSRQRSAALSGVAGVNRLDATISGVAGAVWGFVLTGGTAGVQNSAGRRLRELAGKVILSGTAQAGGASTITLAAGASSVDRLYLYQQVSITGGTGAGQCALIVNYDGATRVATMHRPWRVQPDATSEYILSANTEWEIRNGGLLAGGGASSVVLNADAVALDGAYVGSTISNISTRETRVITGYTGATRTATVETPWQVAPAAGNIYLVTLHGRAIAVRNEDKSGYQLAAPPPSAADIAAAVWAAGSRTLTGFGTLVADVVTGVVTGVWGAASRTLTGFGTLVADIRADLERAGGPLAQAASGSGVDSEDVAAAVRDALFTGPNAVTIRFRDAAAAPVPGVTFTLVGVGQDVADVAGEFVAALPDGDYELRATGAQGVIFEPQTFTVAGGALTVTVTGAARTLPPAPIEPGTCALYIDLTGYPAGETEALTGTLEIVDLPRDFGGRYLVGRTETATADADGRILFAPVPQGARVHLTVRAAGLRHTVTVPAAAVASLADVPGGP